MEQSGAGVVLVVEDDQDTLDLYVDLLTAAGFRCIATGAPDEAISHAEAVHFDAIVMDIGLPRLADGFALAWRLRGIAGAPPIVAVTGHLLDSASSRPFHVQFLKPLALDLLVETVRRIVDAKSEQAGPTR